MYARATIPGNSGSSVTLSYPYPKLLEVVRLPYPYPESTNPTEHNLENFGTVRSSNRCAKITVSFHDIVHPDIKGGPHTTSSAPTHRWRQFVPLDGRGQHLTTGSRIQMQHYRDPTLPHTWSENTINTTSCITKTMVIVATTIQLQYHRKRVQRHFMLIVDKQAAGYCTVKRDI